MSFVGLFCDCLHTSNAGKARDQAQAAVGTCLRKIEEEEAAASAWNLAVLIWKKKRLRVESGESTQYAMKRLWK